MSYQLRPGDAVPFPGSDAEVEMNLATHSFELVPSPEAIVFIPKAWIDRTGVSQFPELVRRCSKCLMYAPSEAVKYPCGEATRLGPNEYLYLRRRPEGWIDANRIVV